MNAQSLMKLSESMKTNTNEQKNGYNSWFDVIFDVVANTLKCKTVLGNSCSTLNSLDEYTSLVF